MALSDPELELLMELLEDDPGADVWFQVGEELVRRADWAEAEKVLSGGLGANPEAPESEAAWALLARASLELGQLGLSLAALENVSDDPAKAPEAARVRFLALERAGRGDAARQAVDAFLEIHPDDVVATSAKERLSGAVVAGSVLPIGRAPDPMVTMDRARRYVAVGRPDRAARVYRRILFHNPTFAGAQAALRELGRDALGVHLTEDLSEEILHPASAPPSLDMPAPALQVLAADDEDTQPRGLPPALAAYARGGGVRNPFPASFDEEPDEGTDPFSPLGDLDGKLSTRARAPRRRQRRRSLLNR